MGQNERSSRGSFGAWPVILGAVAAVALGAVAIGAAVLLRPTRPLGIQSPSAPPSLSVPLAPPPPANPVATQPKEPEWTAEDDTDPETMEAQREALLRKLRKFAGLSEEQVEATRQIFSQRRWMGQGNPKPTTHPMTRAECRRIRAQAPQVVGGESRCQSSHMVPIYNPRQGETKEQASVCIDQFEYPNIPCEYPVTWVPAHLAHGLCQVQGKRLCDAHEWEGACAGAVLPVPEEYHFGVRANESVNARRTQMEYEHNLQRETVWAYGRQKDHTKCATMSRKNPDCVTPTWQACGTNTYPAGAFPECVSPFGVYDLHGNAAEHMNLPLAEDQLASRGTQLGQTEMKGSWFIFSRYEAHLDDCRWRAPDWHGSRVLHPESHMNYHLGFRCCRDLQPLTGWRPDDHPRTRPSADPAP